MRVELVGIHRLLQGLFSGADVSQQGVWASYAHWKGTHFNQLAPLPHQIIGLPQSVHGAKVEYERGATSSQEGVAVALKLFLYRFQTHTNLNFSQQAHASFQLVECLEQLGANSYLG